MIFKDIREKVLREIAECVDCCSSDLWCTVVESFGNEDIHDRILKIFLYFLSTALTDSSKYQIACVHFVHIV